MATSDNVPMTVTDIIDSIGRGIDVAGVLVITVGILIAAALAIADARRGARDVYGATRRRVGRAILLGLELLVAADIIRTVAIEPTLESLAVLAAIVLVRTFLSFTLEVELDGRWPWQQKQPSSKPRPEPDAEPDAEPERE